MLAINQKNRRLPGFRFEAVAPAREDVLPRMDVALFVGFAASGPIGIPVAVESPEQFKTIFGEDLPLVWDAEKGSMLKAYLAPSVRAFFRNGGHRCWILRVARIEPDGEKSLNFASYNFFPLSGLASVDFDEKDIKNPSPALLRARSKGSWSDDLQVAAIVSSKFIETIEINEKDSIIYATVEIGVNETISSGDLLRLTFHDEKSVLISAVNEVNEAAESQNVSPSFGKKIVEIAAGQNVWLKELSDQILEGEAYKVQVKMWTGQKDASVQISPSDFQTEITAILVREKKNSPQTVRLSLSNLSSGETPSVGTVLFTKLKKDTIALLVQNVLFGANSNDAELICQAVALQRRLKMPGSAPQTEVLTFEIWAKKDKSNLSKIVDLAFNPAHERFLGKLPTDEELFRFSDETIPKSPVWIQNFAANFPLAGNGEAFYFPLFPSAIADNFQGALPLRGTKLQRDGLEIFDEDLFLDRKLKNVGTTNLLNEAEFIRYLSPKPRSLWGVHSALVPETVAKVAVESLPTAQIYSNYSLDECTIISVPDAAHRGWKKTEDEGEILSPPVFSPPLRPEWWHFQDCRKPEMKKTSEPLWGNFLDCAIRVVKAPLDLRIRGGIISAGRFTLEWKCAETDENTIFVLEESATKDFSFPQEIYHGNAKHFEIKGVRAGVFYYRVRAEIGKFFSDWSIGLAIRIPQAESMVVNPLQDFKSDVLLAVQRAILRMCAARGDLFAVLDLPEHFDETEAFSHVGSLKTTKGLVKPTAGVEPFSADELRVLSYGALYHPWLLTHEEDFEEFRNVPPDGAICGTFAKRTNERGAWIAPANEKLQGVYGLAKEIGRERFLDFQDNAINLIRQEPRGFIALDSDTLSDETDWRSLNVRRLLSLLRRLALKHGAEYVFEPNDERFRRQVKRGFDSFLDLMFTRGAFAGTTPATSYQVVVSETINNFQSLEQGRFIVELRVAPSLPLKFVTVRLIQTGARSNVIEVF